MSDEADLELDDNGKVISPGITLKNAGVIIPERIGKALAPYLPKPEPLAIPMAKNAADQWAVPKTEWAKNNVPGMQMLAQALSKAQGAQGSRQPEVRQPIQMEREFSNDPDREAYLQRIRQAQENATNKK